MARFARHRKGAQFSSLDGRRRTAHVDQADIQVAAHHIGKYWSATLVRHVHEFDAGLA